MIIMDRFGKQLRANVYLNEDLAQIVENNRKQAKMSLSGYIASVLENALMPKEGAI